MKTKPKKRGRNKVAETDLLIENITNYLDARKTPEAACTAFDRGKKTRTWGGYSASHLNESEYLDFLDIMRIIMSPYREAKKANGKNLVAAKIKNPIEVPLSKMEKLIERANQILSKPAGHGNWSITLALLLVTGRRTSEIFGDTRFTKDEWIGSLKNGNEKGKAYYFAPFNVIDKALKRLERGGEPKEINARVAVPLMRAMERTFGDIIPDLRVHDLRALYAANLKFAYRDKTTDQINDIITDALGHKLMENNGSYAGFTIVQ